MGQITSKLVHIEKNTIHNTESDTDNDYISVQLNNKQVKSWPEVKEVFNPIIFLRIKPGLFEECLECTL